MPSSLWEWIGAEVERFPHEVTSLRVTPPAASCRDVRQELERAYDLNAPHALEPLVRDLARRLRAGTVHVTSPRYFGLFNPSVLEAGVAADTLAACYNLQLGIWSHSPVANELEQLALRHLARALGFDLGHGLATFTAGGQESNTTALLAALGHHCPEWSDGGVRGLAAAPTVYVSGEAHHSLLRAARMTGLGAAAVRVIPATAGHTFDVPRLRAALHADRRAGARPLLIAGTAGTTGTGVIDPLGALAEVAAEHGAWFHVDAAWGGIAALSPALRPYLAGIERADSVTWDAHKGLAVPMGAGMFFTRHADALRRAFAMQAAYMPPHASDDGVDPYTVSAQWSRRAIGLKVFLALAAQGSAGYAAMIERQCALADRLRGMLTAAGWRLANATPLPLVCFTHDELRGVAGATAELLGRVYARGRVWLSEVALGSGERVLRACVTSYRTAEADLRLLVDELELARTSSELHRRPRTHDAPVTV